MTERCFRDLVVASGRLATGLLGWSPDQFWSATPSELTLAIEGRLGMGMGGDTPLGTDGLQRLLLELPDGR